MRLNLNLESDEKNFEKKNVEKLIIGQTADIESLRKSEKNRIYRYGDPIVNLVADINAYCKQNKFKHKPKGPIGMEVSIKDHRYALAVEQCIGAFMTAFICENYDDERLLHQLISKNVRDKRQKPRVIVMGFGHKLYDVSKNRPKFDEYPTVYEMLKIEDDTIANVLIDQCRVESILLLPDRKHTHVIERQSTRDCNQAYLMNGDQLLGLPTFRMYACGQKEVRFFVESTQNAIEHHQNEIKRHRNSVLTIEEQLAALQQQINENSELKKQNDKQIDFLGRQKVKLNGQLKAAEAINIAEPFDVAAFEDEMENIKKEIKQIDENIQKIETDSEGLKAAFDTAKIKVEELQNSMNCVLQKQDELQKKYRQIDQIRETFSDNMDHYRKALDEIIPKVEEKEKSITSQESSLAEVTRAAKEAYSERINTKRSPKTIEAEIKTIEEQISQSTMLHGDEEEISRKYNEMKATFTKIGKDIKKNKAFLNRLGEILRDRDNCRHMFTSGKALRCSMDFSNLLRARNYSGNLIFDHEQQKLEVVVQPNKTKETENELSKDLKSLSGGERSFSTVAFLLSLWSIVESPILFLDEFDVFMDQVNRRFAMELILSAAKEKLNGQYIFLTPQEMGYIKPDKNVKMFKMPDPERRYFVEEDQENQS